MASYGENILPTESEYYTLHNASITGGILSLSAGGSATYSMDRGVLASLTEWFRVTINPASPADNYNPGIFMRISALTVSGTRYSYSCVPTEVENGIYSAELKFESVEYTSMDITITSNTPVNLLLWELCPEAQDIDIQVIIDGVEQSLPRLIYDYNTWPFNIEQEERSIGLITCNLLEQTDLQGHFLLTYTASEATTLTLRFKDNEATELFAPLLYDIGAGRGTVGVPHAYLKRLAGYHNFVVTAQVTEGTLAVGTRDMLFTIDGGYLAERVIDIGVTVGDITIEQKATDYEPSYIWIISVEAGEALVRRRAYTVHATGVAFDPMFSLGRAKEVAIEFDGDWFLDESDAHILYRLNTYAAPYCFFTDIDDSLYVQVGSDASTKQLLDTGVSSISVCRGYKSAIDPLQDQGLICLYLKSGVVYYQQYIYNSTLQIYRWEGPYTVTEITAPVVSATVHRLNDYRVSFAITTATDNYWLISDRTYVNMSSKPETIDIIPSGTFMTFGLFDNEYEALTVSGDISDDRKHIVATFNYPIRCLSDYPADWIEMPASLIDNDEIENVVVEDNTITITVRTALYVPLTFSLYPSAIWQFKANNTTWMGLPDVMEFTYDPYGYIYTTIDNMGTVNVSMINVEKSVALLPKEDLHVEPDETVLLDPVVNKTIILGKVEIMPYNYNDVVYLTVGDNSEKTVSLIHTGTQPI